MSLYDRIFKPHVYTLADGTTVEEKRSRAPLILLVLIALTVLSVRITGFDLAVLVKKGSKFFDILKAMFPPNTAYLGKIWQPLWDTIKMSILGSFIGAVLAVCDILVAGMFHSRKSPLAGDERKRREGMECTQQNRR